MGIAHVAMHRRPSDHILWGHDLSPAFVNIWRADFFGPAVGRSAPMHGVGACDHKGLRQLVGEYTKTSICKRSDG